MKTKKTKVLIIDKNGRQREKIRQLLESEESISLNEAESFSIGYEVLLEKNNYTLALITLSVSESIKPTHLRRLRSQNPGLGIILIGNFNKTNQAIALLKQGLADHIESPNNPASVYSAVRNQLKNKNLLKKNESMAYQLGILKSEQEINARRTLDLEEIYDTTLENLMTALDIRDVETFGHSRTVARYSQVLAQILGIKEDEKLDTIRKGALLHDVGKIAIPDAILKKPSSLSSMEWKKIKLHPSLGYGLIKEIKSLEEVGNIVLCHHERYDGAGYPQGLKKNKIPLEARIFSLADALDAITSHRPYREKRDFQEAQKEIQNNSKTQFDPIVVNAFSSVPLEKWEKIRFETTKLMPSFEEMLEMSKK